MNITLIFLCSPAQFDAVREAFAAKGVKIPERSEGTISQDGVVANFSYDGESLAIVIVKKPWLVTEAYVTEHITEFIDSAIQSV